MAPSVLFAIGTAIGASPKNRTGYHSHFGSIKLS